MADEKNEEIGIIYGKHAKFLAWLMTQDGPWNTDSNKPTTRKPDADIQTIYWPSKPDLPSMILKSSLSKQDTSYIPLETAMAREYLLLEYAENVKKAALDYAKRVWQAHRNSNG